jgi:hypothetical protein
MFTWPINSRANHFNGTIPAFNRFAGAERIGRGPKWRKGSKFDHGDQWRRPLDRNDMARIMFCAETLERRTKQKHKRDGLLGVSALIVLRCLLTYFQDKRTGRLDPGYDDIQRVTGFCRQTIRNALRNLELAGIIEVMRRIVRERVRVWIEEAKQFFAYDRVVQTTNAYMVNYPLPDRKEFGDLGAPLLRPLKYRPSGSRFSTESTVGLSSSISLPKKEDTPPLDPALQNTLDSFGATLSAVK